ncbi:hypothetical protein FB567DRAFT_535166 [Paraphoma chrysanthemicola]|uniref:C2H2-type domain-containing protein n=1 Tax=Paraphoma chrysanthemicola TaxID=798071 RepID=A0A8K0QYW4_9PLEO|nr:hypothetical protein FB567DRAFT_535166 [Paraphoma chrysanthemicola]
MRNNQFIQQNTPNTSNTMTDPHYSSQRPYSSVDPSKMPSGEQKIIGQCPTCNQSFSSRPELHAHMEDPPNHSPVVDVDAISFGEMSSDYDSSDEDPSQPIHRDEAPNLEADGFEFSDKPTKNDGGFEFIGSDYNLPPDESRFPGAPSNMDTSSVHTVFSEEEQPSAEHTSFEQSAKSSRPRTSHDQPEKAPALGILYCDVCNKYFGSERVFKRHFMFQTKHGEESRDTRDLYYRVLVKSWADEAKQIDRARGNADVMEL